MKTKKKNIFKKEYSEFEHSFFLFFGFLQSSENEWQKFVLQRSEDIHGDPEEGSGLHGHQDASHQDVCQVNGQDDVDEWAEKATFSRECRLQWFQTSGDAVNLEINVVNLASPFCKFVTSFYKI